MHIQEHQIVCAPTMSTLCFACRFVVDVSGSMYHFNHYDARLERCCQMAVMIMEALDGFDTKYEWSIAGHSGWAACALILWISICFVLLR